MVLPMDPRRILLLTLLPVALTVAPGCFPPLPNAPAFQRTDAFCDTDDNWNLFAEVTHEDGPQAVQAVYVEVGLAFRDENDEPYTEGAIGDPVDLARVPGTEDEWSAQVESRPDFLDCAYGFEYYLLFVAEDEEGDQAGRTVIN